MSNLHKFRGTLIQGGKKKRERVARSPDLRELRERPMKVSLASGRVVTRFHDTSVSSRIPARAASVGESAAIISSDGGIPERRRRRRRRR